MVGIIALGIAATGVAVAAIPGAEGVITGCHKSNGSLRLIDAEAGQTCSSSEQQITWNQTGPQGPPGADGADGAPGQDGAPGADGVPNATLATGEGGCLFPEPTYQDAMVLPAAPGRDSLGKIQYRCLGDGSVRFDRGLQIRILGDGSRNMRLMVDDGGAAPVHDFAFTGSQVSYESPVMSGTSFDHLTFILTTHVGPQYIQGDIWAVNSSPNQPSASSFDVTATAIQN